MKKGHLAAVAEPPSKRMMVVCPQIIIFVEGKDTTYAQAVAPVLDALVNAGFPAASWSVVEPRSAKEQE